MVVLCTVPGYAVCWTAVSWTAVLVFGNAGKGRTKIPPEAWSGCADVCGGDVLLTQLQICSMQGRKAGEFYK